MVTHLYLKLSLRQVGGGWLAQDSDDLTPEEITFDVKSKKEPEESELSDAKFTWLCVKHVKSNAIVIAKVSSHHKLSHHICNVMYNNILTGCGNVDLCT